MELRTISLLVVLVAAFAAWTILSPKPAGPLDPEWDCARYGTSSAWTCVKKQPFSSPQASE
jgi:hypothetical protein